PPSGKPSVEIPLLKSGLLPSSISLTSFGSPQDGCGRDSSLFQTTLIRVCRSILLSGVTRASVSIVHVEAGQLSVRRCPSASYRLVATAQRFVVALKSTHLIQQVENDRNAGKIDA